MRRPATPPAPESPWLDAVGLLLEAAAGVGQTFGRRLERETGLSLQWFDVLVRLARTPGEQLRMSDLAAQSTLSTSGLTRAVDRLVDGGLVVRKPCPDDRRVTYAVLTAAGRRRIHAALELHVSHLAEVLDGCLTASELAVLTDGLHRLRAVINPGAARASTCPPEGAPVS